ncbi:hypothetical protein [Robiginitomaculum antarcticum]|uniref:hypothetical protein n=1 Tax=Robiginitomaculum antarcticum TaxID=437507 RepID=UPI0012E9B1A2|nr:hypothetical protein [Robiginitomaculum antarcticum]
MSLLICALLLAVPPAIAQSKPTDAEHCFPAKDIAKLKVKLDDIPQKHRGYIVPVAAAKFTVKDDYGMPKRFVYRLDGKEINLPISQNGEVKNIFAPQTLSQDGEFCVIDPVRAAAKLADEGAQTAISFSMGVEAAYPRQSIYSLENLERGLTDGRPVYKKMFGAMGFMVPKLTHVSVGYAAKNPAPKIEAVKDGVKIGGLVVEPFGKTWVVEVAQLEDIGADGLYIGDNFRVLEPGVSIEKMKKFGFTIEGKE